MRTSTARERTSSSLKNREQGKETPPGLGSSHRVGGGQALHPRASLAMLGVRIRGDSRNRSPALGRTGLFGAGNVFISPTGAYLGGEAWGCRVSRASRYREASQDTPWAASAMGTCRGSGSHRAGREGGDVSRPREEDSLEEQLLVAALPPSPARGLQPALPCPVRAAGGNPTLAGSSLGAGTGSGWRGRRHRGSARQRGEMQAGTSVHGQKNRHCSYLQDIQGAAWVLQPSQQPPKLSVLSIRKLFSYPPSNLQQAQPVRHPGRRKRCTDRTSFILCFPSCWLRVQGNDQM